MKTRDKILSQARLLFNQHGLENVSLRQLAKSMEMSDGNLRYHFKTKAELVKKLYFELVESFDRLILDLQSGAHTQLSFLFQSALNSYQQLFAYRFFMLDFVNLMRFYPEIGEHFKQLQVMRRQQFQGIVQHFVAEGIMRAAAYPEEYRQLHDRMEILSDFWLSSAEVVGVPEGQDPVKHFAKTNLSMIYPYLNTKAQAEMQAWLADTY
ncbi:MAG: TetR/AcrR family transcriptional regulator [Bacteroidota bacterium]